MRSQYRIHLSSKKSHQIFGGSGIEDIHQVPFRINDPINLPRVLCPLLGSPISTRHTVLGLVVPVVAELVAVLDDELGSRHDWEGEK